MFLHNKLEQCYISVLIIISKPKVWSLDTIRALPRCPNFMSHGLARHQKSRTIGNKEKKNYIPNKQGELAAEHTFTISKNIMTPQLALHSNQHKQGSKPRQQGDWKWRHEHAQLISYYTHTTTVGTPHPHNISLLSAMTIANPRPSQAN